MTAANVKEQLQKQYPYKIEMHAHTSPCSPCGTVTPDELVNIYSKLGYDAVVITNHFSYGYGVFENSSISKDEKLAMYMKDYENACRAAEKKNIKILLGAELRFSENINDYLLYGADYETLHIAYDYLEEGLASYYKNGKPQNSLLLQAHPFRSGMTQVNPELLDGIETFNMHPGQNSAIGFAVKYASEKAFAVTTAGTDFHDYSGHHQGLSALRTSVIPQDSFELADILRRGDYLFEIGGEAIVLS